MALMIKEVKTGSELRDFIRFPLSLYRNNPFYVPALFMDEIQTLHWQKNPSFDHCDARYWLAYEGSTVVGRVAGIINHKHIEKWGQQYMRFGWLDFVDDTGVSSKLLLSVEDWARQRKLTALHGPLGFTDLDREGMLIEGFDELGTLATLYNHPYYPEHMEQHSFHKDTDWMEFELKVPTSLDPRIANATDVILKRNQLRLLSIKSKRELLSYALELFHLINQEYSHLYGSVPLSSREVQHYTDAYFGFVHTDFIPLIVDEEENLVAFGVAIPSLSRALQKSRGRLLPFGWWQILRAIRHNHRADLYLIAVDKRYRA